MSAFCLKCDKLFAHQSNYNRHCRDVHGVLEKNVMEYDYNVSLFRCKECRVSFKTNENLRIHLSRKHHIKFECEELSFNSYEDFLDWIGVEEDKNNVQYFSNTGRKSSVGTSRIYLHCVRSGKTPKPVPNRKKIMKSQGSNKLNFFCSSQIIVHQFENGTCTVKYYKTHYGHEHNIQYLRIPKSKKDLIASKLIAGVPTQKILENCRGNMGDEIHRSNIITRKDINNVKKAYKIDTLNDSRHPKDATSVDADERSSQDENPDLYYEEQGEPSSEELSIINDDEASKLVSSSSKMASNEKIIDDIEMNALQIISNVKTGNHTIETLSYTLKSLKNILQITEMTENTFDNSFQSLQTEYEPPNKKISKPSVFSTRTKRNKVYSIKKPNKKDWKIIEETLSKRECVSDNYLNDHMYA